MGKLAEFVSLFSAALVAVGVAAAPAQAEAGAGCAGWQVETVAEGLGELENLEPDGRGGFYVSGSSDISHIDADGKVSPVLTGLPAPGGLQLSGGNLFYITRGDGKLWQLDTASGDVTELAALDGHGLLRLPGGDLLTTWVGTDIGAPSKGLTRYRVDSREAVPNWSAVPRSEGLALYPDHKAVFTDDLFTGEIVRVPLDSPERWSVITRIPGVFPGVDDLTMSAAGLLYVAAHIEGSIYRVDPETGASCVIAAGLSSGWTGPSSVRIAQDGRGSALYATLFDGSLRRIRPPDGVDLAPVR